MNGAELRQDLLKSMSVETQALAGGTSDPDYRPAMLFKLGGHEVWLPGD